jgi:SPP1 family predicted phage head-tail adaptor
MRSGSLRTRLTLERPPANDGGDTFDAPAPSGGWTVAGEIWAEVRALNAREATIASQQQTIATHMVRIRYPAPAAMPTARDRFTLASGRKLNIVSVLEPDGRRRTLDITCAERA